MNARPFAIAVLILSVEPVHAQDPRLDHFESHVRPLLIQHCQKCHGPKKAESGLRVDSREALLKGGESGPAAVPEQPGESLLLKAVRHEGLEMPPDEKLPDAGIAALEAWIKTGAVWPQGEATAPTLGDQEYLGRQAKDHWAFQRIDKPALPVSERDNVIDKFVDAQLRRAGLRLNKPADSQPLFRRLNYDVTGLPPSSDDVQRFVANANDEAWRREVDRLLSSPHFGEHWGRHWLDVARYADTRDWFARGDLNYPFAWTYRDYVVRAFNENLPFDDFIRQQIAADHFTTAEDDPARAALGFLTAGPKFLNREHEQIADYIDVVTRGLLGLTVACARCHDHKYDPVSMRDYYALYGIFASSQIPPEFPVLADSHLPADVVSDYEQEKQKRVAAFEAFLEQLKQTGLQDVHQRWGDYLASFYEVRITRSETLVNSTKRRQLKSRAAGALFDRLFQLKREEKWQRHPFFGPWARLSSLKGQTFVKVRDAIAKEQASSVHPEMLVMLKDEAVKDAADLNRRFAMVLQRAMAADEGSPLIDVRALVLDDAGPFSFAARDMESQPEVVGAERGKFDKQKLPITQLDVTHPGAPARAMVMLDRGSNDAPIHLRGDFRRRGEVVPRRFLALAADASEPESPLTKRYQEGSGRRQLAEAIVARNNPLTARVIVNWIWRHYFGRGFVMSSDFGLRTPRPVHHELLDYLAAKFMENDWDQRWLHREILTSMTYRQSSDVDAAVVAADPENDFFGRQTRRRLSYEGMRDAMLAVSRRLDRSGFGKPVTSDMGRSVRRSVYFKVDRVDFDGTRATFDFPRPDAAAVERQETTVPQQLLFALNSPFVIQCAQSLTSDAEFQTLATDLERIEWLHQRILQRAAGRDELELLARFVATPVTAEDQATWKWGYGSGNPGDIEARFRELPHFTGTSYQLGAEFPDKRLGYIRLVRSGGHPGNDRSASAIVRWTSPVDAEIRIQGLLKHASPMGDGVRARTIHGDDIVGEWTAHKSETPTPVQRFPVRRGDTIDFVVDCGPGGPNSDSYQWNQIITILKLMRESADPKYGKGYVWNAREMFHGPPPSKLDTWTLAAQALLVSNEFFFVD